MAVKNKLHNDSGQAIFEMVVFLPFIILLFTLIVTVGNSINGSINQQKATRAYFYFSIAGDSIGMPMDDLEGMKSVGVTSVGLYAFGWKDKTIGSNPYAACYKMNSFLGKGSSNEDCDNPEVDESSTGFVRVFTAYGLCTAVLEIDNNMPYINRSSSYANGCANL